MKFLIFILLLPLVINFQRGIVKGKIYDKNTKETLLGANVVVVGTSKGAASNMNGEYEIRNMTPDKYVLRCTYVGYKPEVKKIIVKNNDLMVVNFYIEKDSSKKNIIITKQKLRVVPLKK